ncbi:hypothetical protein KC19_1G291600 [Ceratodon purpureus]|uniref:CCT domain-containing protein n=1 Tax=Ceratodon purpureus TaxID=3225 RepID=A0A8T0JD36_CERPU|nr:hypothetical protein KC19_1G291600 [Ceratodon purpureus]
MDICVNGEDVDYCLDFSDIVGDDATGEEDSVGASEVEVDVEHHDYEILRLGLSYCKPEIPEFCVMDGFKLYKGCKEELPHEGSKHVASLLRLNYDDILSSWCDDRSLWTDGKRPQTVPEHFAFADPGPTMVPQNDFGIVPELGTCSQANSTSGDHENGSRGARVTRYREKKRSRLFSKKIRYEVRKLNAESRPRMKGRFVKRTSKSR